jgi:hypothetical protein
MQSRRAFLATGVGVAANSVATRVVAQQDAGQTLLSQADDDQAVQDLEVLLPRNRVPLSFVIDDSTCLVNMGHFCTPQFAEALPNRAEYKKPWRDWPREIPDCFVRKFGEWCAEHGVRGKYSIVPYPACVGWVDRELPGWSRQQLQESLKLVRELMVPNWDIHPEMITHTRVIDLKTGRPVEAINAGTMENSYPQEKKSVDELASYLAYALRILERCDLPCEGITTPGGFGNLVKSELSLAVDQAVRDVYSVDLPHYFKYVRTGDQNVEPVLEHLRGQDTDDLRLTVNVPAGTGDWFGGWQGDRDPEPDRYCNQEATSGRMVELIERREPAVMLCHWPGIYSNGSEAGFRAFQRIVTSLEARYGDQTIWMKLSEIGRYWTAKKLTKLRRTGKQVALDAPFAADKFTFRIMNVNGPVRFGTGMRQVCQLSGLDSGTWFQSGRDVIVCLNLPRGRSMVEVG